MKGWRLAAGLAVLALAGCASTGDEPPKASPAATFERNPYPSTYHAYPGVATALVGATVFDGAGARIENGTVLLRDTKVEAVGGPDLAVPADYKRIDATGKFVTPGIIDVHSHLGDYPTPSVAAHSDGNEATDPTTPNVWAEHSVWPQDPGFTRAMANGGITSLQILPGSANLMGGRSVTLKNVPGRTVQAMKFPGAPYGFKMACGENPKRNYGAKGKIPSTRMGNFAVNRATWIKASEYRRKIDNGKQETRDLGMETLAGVLAGEILVHNHCYRADEMATMIQLSKEFGFKIASFHHGVEAYKVRDLLARDGVCGSLWADWWGFKIEAYDGIQQNIALLEEAGACVAVHSDSAEGIQRLNQEAAKALRAGVAGGIDVDREDAVRWITINPAKAIGIDEWTGSLEPGKMADVVIWSGDPFSVYSKAERVFIDGALVFDRNDPALQPDMDFELGLPTEEVGW